MTLEHDELSRVRPDGVTPTSSRRQWGVAAGAALGVAAAIGIAVAITSGADDPHAGPGPATNPTTPPASTPAESPGSPAPSQGDRFPVTLDAPGWSCDPPADEKFTCSHGGVAVLVTIRPANVHDDYLTDPDKASPDQYVSDVHSGVFATIIRMPGDHDTDVAALGTTLQWAVP